MPVTACDRALPEPDENEDAPIGVDPAGCACADCERGRSVPVDSAAAVDLAMEHFRPAVRRPIVNRTGHNLYAVCTLLERPDTAHGPHDLRRHFRFALASVYLMDTRATIEQIH